MAKEKSAKKHDGKKVKQAAKLGKASSKKELKSKGKSEKKKKRSSSSDETNGSGSSSEANPHLEEAKEHLLTVGMAFGLLLACMLSPLQPTCSSLFRNRHWISRCVVVSGSRKTSVSTTRSVISETSRHPSWQPSSWGLSQF